MLLRRVPFLLLLPLVILPWLSTSTVYWRDAAEFILSGVFLDIAHPPGFPTFGALSNLWAHLPLGPLTWRVQLFGSYLIVICLALSWMIFLELRALYDPENSSSERSLISFLLVSLPLILAPGVLRQVITAEAYLLNSTFLLGILLTVLKFERTNDVRWLISGALLSGFGLGNHPALLLFILPVFFVYLLKFAHSGKKIIGIALFFGLLGGSIYGYIPIRSLQNPPLNTGSSKTIERFINLTTAARERTLRPEAITTIGRLDTPNVDEQIDLARSEAEKITNEVGYFLPILAIFGCIQILFAIPWRIKILLPCALGSLLFFFRGWQPDPLIGVWFIGISLGTISLSTIMRNQRLPVIITIVFGIVFSLFIQSKKNLPELQAQLHHTLPQESITEQLNSLPSSSLYLTETSWFLTRQLQSTEGIRKDLVIGYLPQLLFPHFFRDFTIERTEDNYTFSFNHYEETDIRAPQLKNLGKLLTTLLPLTDIVIEPAIVSNTMIAGIGIDTKNGHVAITQDIDSQTENFSPRIISETEKIKSLPYSILQADAASFFETQAIGLSDFLLKQGKTEKALQGLITICNAPHLRICSEQTYITISRYYSVMGQPNKARETLEELIESRGKSELVQSALIQING